MVISIVPVLPIYFILYKCIKYIFENIRMWTLDKYMLKCLQSPLTQATLIIVLSDTHFKAHIWVLASTLDPSVSKINEALSVTYKLLFILSKNIVPSRSYRYIRDRAFL